MISVSEAVSLILASTPTLGVETVKLEEALGRVLAAPVISSVDLPPFTSSAVDGYAFRFSDVNGSDTRLRVTGKITAGEYPAITVGAGSAVRIFTGSALPTGADSVAMQEDVTALQNEVLIPASAKKGSHVRLQGEELRSGSKVFDAGVVVTPSIIGALANLGLPSVTVYRRPRVGILSTGSELAPLGANLRLGQVYASNAIAVASAVQSLGADVGDVRVVGDAPDEVFHALSDMLPVHDCIFTCGGVSVGDHDLVREEAKSAGVREVFWKVAMKPGKPFFLGVSADGKPVYGLPGNPVSALVCFYVLGRPGLMKMMGSTGEAEPVHARLGARITKQRGRTEFLRAVLESTGDGIVANSLDSQGSHMGTGLAHANCLIQADAERESYEAGETVRVVPLQWGIL